MTVRDALHVDLPALRELWDALFDRPGAEGFGLAPSSAAELLDRVEEDQESRLLVAERDGEVVGGVFLRLAPVSPLHKEPAVFVSHLSVVPRAARRGVGLALVQAVVAWAELVGCELVMVATAVQDREANRFLARRGLPQVATLRGASVAALRSMLPDEAGGGRGGSGGRRRRRRVDQVVAARRVRRRQGTGNG